MSIAVSFNDYEMAGSRWGARLYDCLWVSPRPIQDDSGNVYVADTDNHILRQITAAGAVTTFAGSAGSSGAIPGRLPASLFLPQAIALTP